MDALALFTSTQGRLGRKPFWLCVIAIYLAGLAAQLLLVPQVTARGGVWPFVLAQAMLLWAWLAVHIKRLRDAGQGPAGAVGVALIYALAIVLMLLMVAFLTNPNSTAPGGQGEDNAAFSLLLVIVIFSLLFSPDFGVFMTILKVIVFIACLPAVIALVFSLVTGLRKSLAA